MKPDGAKELWADFLETATVPQHTMAGRGIAVPSKLEDWFYSRALKQQDPTALCCWLASMPSLVTRHYLGHPELVRDVLKLSAHSDLRVRRGALRVIEKASVLAPWGDQDVSDTPWWEAAPISETQHEKDAGQSVRDWGESVLQRFHSGNNASAPSQNDDTIQE